MSEIIDGQVTFVLVSICSGMALMFGYEVFRILRWLFPHGKWLVWVEDISYWVLMSIPCFVMFYYYNEGEIRWYGLLMLIVGAVLYENGIGIPIRSGFTKVTDKLSEKIKKQKKQKKNRANKCHCL